MFVASRRAHAWYSFLWEKFITLWNYYFVTDLTPAHLGLFEGTPVRIRPGLAAIH